MNSILKQIVEYKQAEVEAKKRAFSIGMLEQSRCFGRKTFSLKNGLLNSNSSGIIAEFKRRSPSKGLINGNADIRQVVSGYEKAGASAVSVLTDTPFFGGCNNDLLISRELVHIPVLRKEFIVDEYQIVESKAIGAGAILLIAAILSGEQMSGFCDVAHQLGLEVLVEVHAADEIAKIPEAVDVVGVNNRNLNTFAVDFHHSANIVNQLPKDVVKIAESGISSVKNVEELQRVGFQGFLIGETFMKNTDPAETCRDFIDEMNRKHPNSSIKLQNKDFYTA